MSSLVLKWTMPPPLWSCEQTDHRGITARGRPTAKRDEVKSEENAGREGHRKRKISDGEEAK